jgi:hypothetical protein
VTLALQGRNARRRPNARHPALDRGIRARRGIGGAEANRAVKRAKGNRVAGPAIRGEAEFRKARAFGETAIVSGWPVGGNRHSLP